MSDKWGDIARTLGCEVTEEATYLREAIVKQEIRAAKLERIIKRLRAERDECRRLLREACDGWNQSQKSRTMCFAGGCFVRLPNDWHERVKAAKAAGGGDD